MSLELHPEPPPPPRRRGRDGRWLLLLAGAGLVPGALGLPVVLLGLSAAAGALLVRRHRRRALAAPSPAPGERIQLGRDGGGHSLDLDARQLSAHGLIVGASGAGKTTTLLTIACQQIIAGRGLVAIDLKGSPEFAAALADAAARSGRALRVWSPDGPGTWNPLGHGNPTELKDKLISTERFSEPHYQRAAERYVQLALSVRAQVMPDTPPTLGEVVDLLAPSRLAALARRLDPPAAARVGGYLRELGPDQVSAVRGLQSRLAVITESHTGRFFEPGPGAIDLLEALGGGDVVLFSLNASSYGQLSAQIGGLVLQDLVSAAGTRERAPAARAASASVLVDEFSALGADHVMALVARGRSAGVSVLMATQELADLDRVGRGFRDQVIGSTALKIAHRQDIHASAQAVAALSGTERVWERSYSAAVPGRARGRAGDGERTHDRLIERTRVDPSVIQSLRVGEAVVITKLPHSDTRLARIAPLSLPGPPGTKATAPQRPPDRGPSRGR
ncbi:MAG TPA: TraM recognition domain-containing protein [Solirubrobacteraceae bacterium]|nr:TraM recognition domain-containing protein [Solirubrobacteraceae bacterium]